MHFWILSEKGGCVLGSWELLGSMTFSSSKLWSVEGRHDERASGMAWRNRQNLANLFKMSAPAWTAAGANRHGLDWRMDFWRSFMEGIRMGEQNSGLVWWVGRKVIYFRHWCSGSNFDGDTGSGKSVVWLRDGVTCYPIAKGTFWGRKVPCWCGEGIVTAASNKATGYWWGWGMRMTGRRRGA